MLPMPKKLLKEGHRDMLRLSDARMSGTSYGACVLHVAPESLYRRPAGAAADRRYRLDRRRRAQDRSMEVSDEELAARRAAWTPPRAALRARLWLDVHQAHPAGGRRAATSTSCAPNSARRSPNPPSTERRPPCHFPPRPATKLRGVSTATLATALFKRGLRRQMIQDVLPLAAPSAQHGRRGLHAALHAGARGPEPHRRVPRTRRIRSARRSRTARPAR